MFKELFIESKTWSDKQQKYIDLSKMSFWEKAKEQWHNISTVKDYGKDPDQVYYKCSSCKIKIPGREMYDKLGELPNPKNKTKCPNCGKNTLEIFWEI